MFLIKTRIKHPDLRSVRQTKKNLECCSKFDVIGGIKYNKSGCIKVFFHNFSTVSLIDEDRILTVVGLDVEFVLSIVWLSR